MEKRQLGQAGMPVTALGYGVMELRHLENVAAATRSRLSDEVYTEAKRRLDAVGVFAGEV
jgi:aryl-alcohol dehydrogenase-like predicted oxidoreductase